NSDQGKRSERHAEPRSGAGWCPGKGQVPPCVHARACRRGGGPYTGRHPGAAGRPAPPVGADGAAVPAAGTGRGEPERSGDMRRALAVAGVVVTAGCWLSTVTHPAVAAVVVTLTAGLATRRALRMATLRRQTTGPLVDILHRSLGVNVTL